jgi:hypothetical protein
MLATSSFAGKILGSYQYLFFVMYEDYTDFGRAFVKEFNAVYLERLARNLKGHGAVVVPFQGDIESTREEILGKEWTLREFAELDRLPAVLVIDQDFDDFSPRTHPWVIFHFGEANYGSSAGLTELDKTLKAIAASVTDPEAGQQSLYSIAREITSDRPDLGLAFSLQPNIFGFSIDIMQAGRYLRGVLHDRHRQVGREFT